MRSVAIHGDNYATNDDGEPNDPRREPFDLSDLERARLAELRSHKRNGTLAPPLSTQEAKRLLGLPTSEGRD